MASVMVLNITQKEERIGVIAVGYGDGLRRMPGNQVLIRGTKADIIGNVCMDHAWCSLTICLKRKSAMRW